MALAASAWFFSASQVPAADLYWDVNLTLSGTGGNGPWGTVATWRKGSETGTFQAWADNNNAIFGGTAGTVTLGSTKTVSGITFSNASGNYSLISQTIVLGQANTAINTATIAATNTTISSLLGISSSGNTLEKTGDGTLSLTGNLRDPNTGIKVSAGTLNINKSGYTWGNLGLLTMNGGTFVNQTGAAALNAVTWQSATGAISSNTNGNTITGTMTQTSGSNLRIRNGTGADWTISGQITGSGALVFNQDASNGATSNFGVTSNTANDYSGGTQINGCTLRLGASEVIPSGAGKGDVSLSPGGSAGSAYLDLYGYSETVNGLASSGAARIFNNRGSGTSLLTVGDADATSIFAGAIADTNADAQGVTAGGKVALTKIGLGALTLTGDSTYTGDTQVNSGMLVVNGSLGNTAVTVNDGATLAGGGTIAGPVSIAAGGTISPGNSPGSLATGDQTWIGGGQYHWDLDQTNSLGGLQTSGADTLAITGALDLSGLNPNSRFIIDINSTHQLGSLVGDNWDPAKSCSWIIAGATTIRGFSPDLFTLKTDRFASTEPVTGTFSVTEDGNNLVLAYANDAPATVPLPTAAWSGLALLAGVCVVRLARARRAVE
ncbi:MAG: beta strand repeat-containing protein [Tepidisphaerales bacterium]